MCLWRKTEISTTACRNDLERVWQGGVYADCICENGYVPVDRRYGLEPGKVTAGLAHLIALSGIKESFDEGRKSRSMKGANG